MDKQDWIFIMTAYNVGQFGRFLKGVIGFLFITCAMALQAQGTARDFDHLKTGFALSGVHSTARCESCHVDGVFKGAPKDCFSCHTSGMRFAKNNVVKPQIHVPTQLVCETCHSTKTFIGAKFNHSGVVTGTCSSCHNGGMAPGKVAGHVLTQASCDSCHKTSAWLPASNVDHSNFTPATNCSYCHNSSKATGKNPGHIPTVANCTSCHSVSGWKPTKWNHTQSVVANQCSTCHSGANPPADGPPSNHIPYKALTSGNCDSCHRTGYSTWTPAKFHANVSVLTGCATCHATGTFGLTVKPNNTTHAGVTVCETCHKSTGSWSG
ncbi:cytochrome c3 family protein, partial [Rhodoferax sp.]|uniref:cytochrome c3 family protein n=1 Tax=Rhodoferax sp. TaxID=50421 RepID=UPI00260DF252